MSTVGIVCLVMLFVFFEGTVLRLLFRMLRLEKAIKVSNSEMNAFKEDYERETRELRDQYAYLVNRYEEMRDWLNDYENHINERFVAMLDVIGNTSENISKGIDEMNKTYESLQKRNELLDNELRENCRHCREVWEKIGNLEGTADAPGSYRTEQRDILNPFGLTCESYSFEDSPVWASKDDQKSVTNL